MARGRAPNITEAKKKEVIAYAKEFPELTYSEIGKALGLSNQSVGRIISIHKKETLEERHIDSIVEKQIQEDINLKKVLNKLENHLAVMYQQLNHIEKALTPPEPLPNTKLF
jgi:hypothetical protein